MDIDKLFQKKKAYKNAHFSFRVEGLTVECNAKYERLNPKHILPFEEFNRDKVTGKRVIAKKVGYVNGTLKFFHAIQNEKGKWIPDTDKPVSPDRVEKVILDRRTNEVKLKDTLKGLWFVKVAPKDILAEWLIEDTYNIWGESDNFLRVYQYLMENNVMGIYKFNPNGTLYHAFLIPQRLDNTRFRLLLQVARVRTNKPEISPSMTITDAKEREREKKRLESIEKAAALEEI